MLSIVQSLSTYIKNMQQKQQQACLPPPPSLGLNSLRIVSLARLKRHVSHMVLSFESYETEHYILQLHERTGMQGQLV